VPRVAITRSSLEKTIKSQVNEIKFIFCLFVVLIEI